MKKHYEVTVDFDFQLSEYTFDNGDIKDISVGVKGILSTEKKDSDDYSDYSFTIVEGTVFDDEEGDEISDELEAEFFNQNADVIHDEAVEHAPDMYLWNTVYDTVGKPEHEGE